jgi:hypothetical protein
MRKSAPKVSVDRRTQFPGRETAVQVHICDLAFSMYAGVCAAGPDD